jgi:hypothetical protein
MPLLKSSMIHFRGIGLKHKHDPTACGSSQMRQGAQILGQGIDLPIVG